MSSAMREISEEVREALLKAGEQLARGMKDQSDRQARRLLEIVEDIRRRDSVMEAEARSANGTADARFDSAQMGNSSSNNYRDIFRDKNSLAGDGVVVHHAVEQQVLRRWPDAVTRSEMNSWQNLRGIPNNVNGPVHLSGIRRMWNVFYKHHDENGSTPTKAELLRFATLIDDAFGHLFDPPVRRLP